MKVLYITTSSLTYNGIGMCIMNYFENIDNQNIKIDFVVPNIVDENIKEIIMSRESNLYELTYNDELKLKQKKPLLYCIKLYKIIKKGNYDIVHVHGSSSMMFMELFAAKLAGCKTRIAHSHNTKSDYGKLDKFFRPFFNLVYTDAFACGEEAGKWLFKNKKFEIINNAVNIKKYKYNESIRQKMRKKYKLEGKKVIGHVGNFNNQKNHDYLIEIFNSLIKKDTSYYLVLIGFGELQGKIQQKVDEYGIRNKVIFIGKSEEVEKWLQAMDLMILPSKFEGFPIVLVEWQIAGLPCIISDRITNKVKLTDLVQFISIDQGIDNWINAIEKINIDEKNRIKNQPVILDKIKEQGFDIREEAKKLEEKYIKLLTKSK